MRALVILALLCGTAGAHGMRMGSLHVEETSATRAIAEWSSTVPDATAVPAFDPRCTATAVTSQLTALDCPDGIAGTTLGVTNLGNGHGATVTEATLFVRFRDGRTASQLVTARAPQWTVPRDEPGVAIGGAYILLGLDHIAHGADHLLFLLLLALLLRRPRDVLLAETAFTLSHSLSFSAMALGWVHVPAAPAEACIALSLVLCAYDVDVRATTARNAGIALAFLFGLVHGLGFAGGLHELGVPDAHAAFALVGFGVGVEIGQVVFLLLVLAAITVAQRSRYFTRAVPVVATGIGALSMAWLIERLLAL